jgi:hypothetical protein
MSESMGLLIAVVGVVVFMWLLGWLAGRGAHVKKGGRPKPWLKTRSSRKR